MRSIVLIAHNLRSCHNVGSLLRTAEGLGVQKVYLTGYTPYPAVANDTRMPHISANQTKQIQKTALGAETMVDWRHDEDVFGVIEHLKQEGFTVAALEQTKSSILLIDWKVPENTALIVGREVEGLESEVIAACKLVVMITMQGKKESFNVVQAAAMALYHCRYF